MNDNNPICIIGARKGSKRLPQKNQLLINNVPLYQYTIRAAVDSKLFKHIVFSTDDETILNDLKDNNDILLDARPLEMSTEHVSMMEVTNYLINKYNQYFTGNKNIGIMTPCNPLRTSSHICDAYKLFKQNDTQSLISITEYPFPIERSLEVINNSVNKSWDGRVDTSKFTKKYYPNGAILFVSQKYFTEFQSFYSKKTIGYILKWPFSLDIDYKDDYELAKSIIEKNLITCIERELCTKN